VLGSLGLDRHGLWWAGTVRAAPIALAAAVTASVAAWLASPVGPVGLGRSIEITPGLHFDAPVVLGGTALVMVITLLAGFRGALIAVRHRPARPRRHSLGARLPLVGRCGLGLVRGRDRPAVWGAVGAGAAALAMVIGAVSLAASRQALLNHPARYGQNWDVQAGNFGNADEVNQGESALAHTDPTLAHNATRYTSTKVNGRPSFVFAFSRAAGPIGPTIAEGRAPTRPDEAALGQATMNGIGVGIGDSVTIAQPADAKATSQFRVVGQVVVNDGIDASQPLTDGVLVTSSAMDRIDRVSTAESLLLATPRGSTDAALVDRLRPTFGEMVGRQRPPDDVANLSRVSALPSVLAILVAVLATVSLVNALVTVTSRHRHDLGVYRALGFTPRQVVAACTTIGLAVGATAVLIGLPLGASIAIWGWRAVEDWVGEPSRTGSACNQQAWSHSPGSSSPSQAYSSRRPPSPSSRPRSRHGKPRFRAAHRVIQNNPPRAPS
jgi:hypothetical protein